MLNSVHSFSFITATYGADEAQFSLLRKSIEYSKLHNIPHKFVVHTEDKPVFERYQNTDATCFASADLLPEILEKKRISSAYYSKVCGSRVTTWLGGTARRLGVPKWPHYTGWHMQQISKLSLAASCDEEYAIIIDSDALITPNAHFSELNDKGSLLCFSQRVDSSQVKGKVKHWNASAKVLFQVDEATKAAKAECYFDTPFILHVPTLKDMFKWLEATYEMPWWQAMLKQAPRRWSEFQCYRMYLDQHYIGGRKVTYKEPTAHRYVFDSNNEVLVLDKVGEWLKDSDVECITLHSHSAGKKSANPTYFSVIEQQLADANAVG